MFENMSYRQFAIKIIEAFHWKFDDSEIEDIVSMLKTWDKEHEQIKTPPDNPYWEYIQSNEAFRLEQVINTVNNNCMDRMDKICKWINNLLELIKSDTNHAHDRTDAVADITYNKEKKLDKIITDVQIGLHNLEEKVRGKFQELDTLLEWAKRQSEIIQGRRIDRLEKRKK